MIDQKIHLAGSPNTLAALFSEFTESGLVNAILDLGAVAAEVTKLTKAAKEEYLHRRRNEVTKAYAAKGDKFGVIHLTENGTTNSFRVELDTPKKVDWDQNKLATLELEIRETWKADASEYIDHKLSVKEAKYKAWPSDLRAKFEPARTVKAENPSLKITLIEKE